MARFIRVLSILLILIFAPLAANAQTLANRVPDDALLYAGWAGTDALQIDYASSNLKGVLDASMLPDFITEKLPAILFDKMNANGHQTDIHQVKQLFAVGNILWKHPAAVYFGAVNWTHPKDPRPQLAIVCDAGGDAAKLLQLYQQLMAQNAPTADPPMQALQIGNTIVLTVGEIKPAGLAVLRGTGSGATLATKKEFLGVLNHVRAHSALCFYADPAAILSELDRGLALNPDTEMVTRIKATIAALGVSSLQQGIYVAGFENKGWTEEAFIGLSRSRQGLFSLVDSKPFNPSILKLAPRDAVAVDVSQFDLHQLFTQVRAAIPRVDSNAAKEFESKLAMVNNLLTFDVDKDFLALLGTQYIVYQTEAAQGSPAGSTFVLPLKDAAAFTTSLALLENFAEDHRAPLQHDTVNGVAYTSFHARQFAVAWTVDNGNLIITQPQNLAAALEQATAKDSILDNPDYQAVVARFGPTAKQATALEYANVPKIYPAMARAFTSMTALANLAGVNLSPKIIPEPDQSAQFLTSGGAISWMDDDGAHMKSFSAFPGASLVSGQQSSTTVGAAAMGTAILLPAMGRSRQMANRAADAANLTGIGKACIVYAQDHNNQLPEDLAELVAANMISPRTLINKSSNSTAAVITPEQQQAAAKDWQKIASDIESHCDYIYLGTGVADTTDPSIVIALDKPSLDIRREGVNVVFGDAHTEWVRRPQLRGVMQKNNEARKAAKQPEVDIDLILNENPEQ